MSGPSRRHDFPILERQMNGRPMAYLDSAATSQKPNQVIEAEAEFYRKLNANVHRGVYALSEEATAAYEASRQKVAKFIGARDPSEIVFVRGTTEAINLVATSLSRGRLQKGDRVVSTEMEHHSNIVPWYFLREHPGIKLDFVGLTDDGKLREEDVERLVTRGTKMTTFTHVSNVLGTQNRVRELAERARDAGSLSLLDAAQSVPHLKLDVEKLGVDLLAFSGHKVFGPTGIGVLWGRKEVLESMAPYMGGGEMIVEVGKETVTYKEPPYKFEAGTPNIAGAVTLGAALDYVTSIGWDELEGHDRRLVTDAYTRLQEAFGDDIKIYGPHPREGHVGVVSFVLKGVHPHDLASLLDSEGVAIRAGHHCAQLIMHHYGVSAMSRASYAIYNTEEETTRLIEALQRAKRLFTGI